MLVTVAEYAESIGENKANIYRRLETELAHCAVRKNGRWFIDTDKINSQKENAEEKETVETDKEQEEQANNDKQEERIDNGSSAIEEELRKQIEFLKEQLKREQESNRLKEEKLLDMTQQVIKLTENAQVLTARLQEKKLLSDGSEGKSGIWQRIKALIHKNNGAL